MRFSSRHFVSFVFMKRLFARQYTSRYHKPIIRTLFCVKGIRELRFRRDLFRRFVNSMNFFRNGRLSQACQVKQSVCFLSIGNSRAITSRLTHLTSKTDRTYTMCRIIRSYFRRKRRIFAGSTKRSSHFVVVTMRLSFRWIMRHFGFLFFYRLRAMFERLLLANFDKLPFWHFQVTMGIRTGASTNLGARVLIYYRYMGRLSGGVRL